MKTRKIALTVLAAVLALTLPIMSVAEGAYGAAAVTEGQTYTVEQMLTYALQDEYLAQATYQAVIAAFGAGRPYTNIEKAEGRHIAELKTLFAAHGIAIPEDTAAGLVTLPATLEETYPLEAQTEVTNIAMYATFLKQEGLPDDVKAVFTALMKGSESHLAAFERQAGAAGGTGYGRRWNDSVPANGAQNGVNDGRGGYGARNSQSPADDTVGPQGYGRGGRGRTGHMNRMNGGCNCGACPQN